MRLAILFILLAALSNSASAQWTIENSGTTANLRGIHNVDGNVAWASGTQGTVLRTTNAGRTWTHCSTPPGAENLDFGGIQAFDENFAIVVSTGPGDQSRIYKTNDGCVTWVLLFTNPDAPHGSFKAMQFLPGIGRDKGRVGDLIGDPIKGAFFSNSFPIFRTNDYGKTWTKREGAWKASARYGEVLLAASNSSVIEIRNAPLFVTGGAYSRSRTEEDYVKHDPSIRVGYVGGDLPLQHGKSAGAASVAARLGPDSLAASAAAKYIERVVYAGDVLVAVGGDPQHPENSKETCAVSTDGSLHWVPSKTPPHGYRSSVAYDADSKTWITVGPNGTDISIDDGMNWHTLSPSKNEPTDADKNWNALSLPFAVGSDVRIGKLRPDALKP